MKKICILFVILATVFASFSQENMIQNGTFEISNEYVWSDYCYTGPIFNDYIYNWESRQSYVGKYKKGEFLPKIWQKVKRIPKNENYPNAPRCRCVSFHSPDWGYRTGIGNTANIGLYELIQQKFTSANKLVDGKHYLLTFDFMLPENVINTGGWNVNSTLDENDKLVFYVSKKKAKYRKTGKIADNTACYTKSEPELFCDCNWESTPSGYAKYQNGISQNFYEIGSKQIQNYNIGEKYSAKIYFNAPEDADNYDWFVIDVHSKINTYNNPYVAIGNISLTEIDYCNPVNPCSPTDGTIVPSNPYPIPNSKGVPFKVGNLDNVYSATNIRIIDVNGYTYTLPDIYSINGIYEPISWNGYDGDNALPQGNYQWEMILENDCGIYNYNRNFVISGDMQNTQTPATVYNNETQTPLPCCEAKPNIFLQNISLTGEGELKYVAQNNIYIEDVIIENEVDFVSFQARNEIFFEGEFVSNNNFGAFIKECEQKNNSITKGIINDSIIYPPINTFIEFQPNICNNKILNHTNSQSLQLNISPNPASNSIKISYFLPQTTDYSIEIYNIFGQKMKLIDTGNKTEGNYQFYINLSFLQNGVYFCVLKTSQGVVNEKIVKI